MEIEIEIVCFVMFFEFVCCAFCERERVRPRVCLCVLLKYCRLSDSVKYRVIVYIGNAQ